MILELPLIDRFTLIQIKTIQIFKYREGRPFRHLFHDFMTTATIWTSFRRPPPHIRINYLLYRLFEGSNERLGQLRVSGLDGTKQFLVLKRH